MASQDLAKIEKISDLRSVWPNEASNFTPWLADNIHLLGEALGMDLEKGDTEAPVGNFSVDILTSDNGNGQLVVIENQLAQTDHSHLGQLLTYMAGRNANVIVWIAERFRDEHRAALDALNERTGEDTQFFGIEVELWQIDNSRPAVNFKLVATPNGWSKQTGGRRSALSEEEESFRTFFQELVDSLTPTLRWSNRKLHQRVHRFSAGHGRKADFRASFSRDKERCRVEVCLDGQDGKSNKGLFDHLVEHRVAIEAAIGVGLEWERWDDRPACRISVTRPGAITADEETLVDIQQWMVANLLKFKQAFGPRLDDLIEQL